ETRDDDVDGKLGAEHRIREHEHRHVALCAAVGNGDARAFGGSGHRDVLALRSRTAGGPVSRRSCSGELRSAGNEERPPCLGHVEKGGRATSSIVTKVGYLRSGP